MQTFLPCQDYHLIARILDQRRLGKQLVECDQILEIVSGEKANSWSSHPAVRMWQGHYAQLVYYGSVMYAEWQRRYDAGERGGKLTHKSGEKITRRYHQLADLIDDDFDPHPRWLDNDICASHRAALLFKDPDHYGKFGWTERPQGPIDGVWQYVWPV